MKKNKLSIKAYNYYYSISRNEKESTSPIIFINGAFQDMNSWHFMRKYFENFTTTVVLDLPGWGMADHLPKEIDFDLYSEAINKVLEQEEVKQVNIISTSYGTPISTHFAKQYKSKINNLVLTSPLMEIGSNLASKYPCMKQLIQNKDYENLYKFLLEIGLMNVVEGKKGNIKQFELIAGLFEKQVLKLTKEKSQKFISNTERIMNYGTSSTEGIEDIRTLVMTGEHDTFTCSKSSRALADTFNNATFKMIPETDHFYLFENPRFAIKLIDDFLLNPIAKRQTSKDAYAMRA